MLKTRLQNTNEQTKSDKVKQAEALFYRGEITVNQYLSLVAYLEKQERANKKKS